MVTVTVLEILENKLAERINELETAGIVKVDKLHKVAMGIQRTIEQLEGVLVILR